MDGHTLQRIRLAEKEAAALKQENTYLSARVLQMSERLDTANKAMRQEKLLSAALIRLFGGETGELTIPIRVVDELRAEMSTPPGLAIHLEKCTDDGYWRIALRKNPDQQRMIHQCSACGHDHVDNLVTREPTDEEKAHGVVWVALCPVRNVEVMAVATDEQKRAIDAANGDAPPAKPLIEVVR